MTDITNRQIHEMLREAGVPLPPPKGPRWAEVAVSVAYATHTIKPLRALCRWIVSL